MSVIGEDEQSINFGTGTYNKETGLAIYTSKAQADSSSAKHWFTLLYACCLAFLALSSLWMYRPENGNFKRGLVLASAGFAFAALVLVA